MPLNRLQTSLNERVPPVILILGDAQLLVSRAIKMVETQALPLCGIAAFNHSSFRFSEPNAVDSLSVARTLPMMSDHRLVVVRDTQEANASDLEAVLEYINKPADSTVLVLAGAKFPAAKKGEKNWGTRIRNAVKKIGYVVSLSNSDVSPVGFVQQQVNSLGKEIARRDAEILVELVGDNLGRLSLEVEKLVLFVGDEHAIGSAAIHQACSLLAEAVIWDLTTALVNRNANSAIASLHRLLEAGDAPHRLLAMIVWQFRTILQGMEMLQNGHSDDAVRKTTRMRWDTLNVVKKMARSEGQSPPSMLLGELASANREMNRHRAGGRRILESLVLRMCS